MKMGSNKGSMLCRHLGNSGDFFFHFEKDFFVFWFKYSNILLQQLQGSMRTLCYNCGSHSQGSQLS